MDGWRVCELHLVFHLQWGTKHTKHLFVDCVQTYCQWSAIASPLVCQSLTCIRIWHTSSAPQITSAHALFAKRLQVCTSTNRWHGGEIVLICQQEIDTNVCSRLCSGVLRYVLMPCAYRYSLLWKKRVEIHNKVFKMKSALAIVMVFVGCCSNVVFLELLVK